MRQSHPSPLKALFLISLAFAGVASGLAGCTSLPAVDLSELGARVGLPGPANGGAIEASGTIEGEEVIISAELGGRIVRHHVREGQEVALGQILIELDDALLEAQIAQARAVLGSAEAELAQVVAGPRRAQVAGAEAAVAQMQVRAQGAERALADAMEIRDNPLSLDTQIHAAEAQVKLTEASVEGARALLSEARVRYEASKGGGSDVEKSTAQILLVQVEIAEANLELAGLQVEGARSKLAELRRVRDMPAALEAAVHQAETAYRLAVATVGVKEAELALLRAGPMHEEIVLAQRKVTLARSAVERLEVQREKLTLRAPLAGVISSKVANEGETALPGATLMTLTDLSHVRLVIYVPTGQIGGIRLAQEAEVRVDSYPDRVFMGHVIHIATEAEFTPRSVQTKEERANTVFAVKIALENPTQVLKPGMPADATLNP
jgi:HlyD family secretion protein